MNKKTILDKAERLMQMHKAGHNLSIVPIF